MVCPCTVFPVSRATDQPGDSAEMSASFNSFYVFLFVFLNKKYLYITYMYGTLLPDSRTLFFHFLSLCYLWVWMEAALFGQLF